MENTKDLPEHQTGRHSASNIEHLQFPAVKHGWLRALIFVPIWFVLAILLSRIADGIYLQLGGIHSTDASLNPLTQTILLLPQVISVLVAIYICRRWIDRQDFSSLGLFPKWKEFILGALFGVILISIGCFVMTGMGWIELKANVFNARSFFGFVLMFMLVAINEEMLCRTYFLSSLMDSTNKFVALFIVSLLFGLLHIFNPDFTWLSFFEISLAGILLGLWYIYRKNIWFPIGLHFTWNFFQGPVFGFEVSGQVVKNSLWLQIDKAEAILSGGKFGLEGSIAGVAVTILGCGVLFWFLNRTKKIDGIELGVSLSDAVNQIKTY